jgi:hypothetical protein
VLLAGKAESDYTDQEQRDALLWKLGPAYRRGLKPPPDAIWYTPNVDGKPWGTV